MAETSLKPCPFCGGEAELERDNDHHGEWFNLGCARNWNRVGPDQACPGGYIWYTADPEEEAAAIAAWNRRATDPAVAELVKALLDATAHLVGAADAYRKHAARHKSKGRAVPDPMFSTRADDFDKAANRARVAIAKHAAKQEKDHG